MVRKTAEGTIVLTKEYPSIYGAPVLRCVDRSIFSLRYFATCLECGFCNDNCCSSGVDIDLENIERIMEYADEMEEFLKVPRNRWFTWNTTEDNEFQGGCYQEHG